MSEGHCNDKFVRHRWCTAVRTTQNKQVSLVIKIGRWKTVSKALTISLLVPIWTKSYFYTSFLCFWYLYPEKWKTLGHRVNSEIISLLCESNTLFVLVADDKSKCISSLAPSLWKWEQVLGQHCNKKASVF